MKTNNRTPILQFDFENKGPIIFTEPIKIISTWKISEVMNCLEQMQTAQEEGFYVAGYMSYEVAYTFIRGKNIKPAITMPLLWFGVYEKPSLISNLATKEYSIGDWKWKGDKETYEKAFQAIQQAIEQGITNQVNYTIPFETTFSGSAYSYYKQLKEAQQSNYCAYLDIGNYQILSASPELFFKVINETITVKPMKGTIHRGKTYDEDIENATWLKKSKKNRLENDLIINLMKEELEQIAKKDNVYVMDRYHVEKYPTVYQMTSTMKAHLLDGITVIDLIKTLFPCGSISGAPKKETMDLILQLENQPRDVYCGAIGYMTPEKEAVFNVPIRTVAINKQTGRARYGAGGAITSSSNLDEEYKEVFTKTKVLYKKREHFELIETFGLYNGSFLVWNEHLQRLKKSANYFNFKIDQEEIISKLSQCKTNYKQGKWRVRLLLNKNGNTTIQVNPLKVIHNRKVTLANSPLDPNNLFLYHKTTNRKIYHERLLGNHDVFDVILWNKDHEVTEFTIGNIVVELSGKLVTPPVSSGLLPGTYREKLLREGIIEERKIFIDDLYSCSKIWLINSVREWVEVDFVQKNT